jgi:hypothetical protein
MNAYLEADFSEQKMRLAALRLSRENTQAGSEAADEFDRKIMAAENLIQSYETLKWYER